MLPPRWEERKRTEWVAGKEESELRRGTTSFGREGEKIRKEKSNITPLPYFFRKKRGRRLSKEGESVGKKEKNPLPIQKKGRES